MNIYQAGFSLVSAIFLLVVIAALGLFSVTITTTQQLTSTQDLLGSRAYQAAKAGIEWGAYQITKNGATCVPASSNIVAMPAGQLSGFNVTVTCTASAYTEGSNSFSVYQLTSTAHTGVFGSISYAERQLSLTLKHP